jgi:Fe-S-cluster containining protein
MSNNEYCNNCGECCKGNIIISGLEALWLVGREMPNDGIGCPFLSKGKCSVYDCRPIVCREYGPRKFGGDPTAMNGLVKFGTCKNYLGADVKPNPMMTLAVESMIEQSGMVELSTDRKPGDKSVGRFKLVPEANGKATLIADPDYCGDVVLSAAISTL